MEHYGKPSDLAHLMQQWTNAIVRDGKFHQQMDPVEGTFTNDSGEYSPAALALVDFTWRLAGVRREGDTLQWNVRPPAAAGRSRYRLKIAPSLTAELRYSSGNAELFLNDKLKYRTGSVVRLVTDMEGKLRGAVGIAPAKSTVVLELASHRRLELSLQPNASRRL
jgi:hypothetical protein